MLRNRGKSGIRRLNRIALATTALTALLAAASGPARATDAIWTGNGVTTGTLNASNQWAPLPGTPPDANGVGFFGVTRTPVAVVSGPFSVGGFTFVPSGSFQPTAYSFNLNSASVTNTITFNNTAIVNTGTTVQTFTVGGGGPGTGAGLCVFTSIEHSGRYQNEPSLIGFQKKLTHEPGGGYPDKVDAMLAKYAPNVVYVQYTGKDVSLLKLAMKTGRMVSVTYGYSPRYGGPIAHMVNLVHLTDKWAAVLDNNFPGEDQHEWMAPDEFVFSVPEGRRIVAPGESANPGISLLTAHEIEFDPRYLWD